MNDNERVELNELCSALVDGVLSAEGNARLQAMLRQSEEARRFYVRVMQLSATLHQYAQEMQTPAALPAPARWPKRVWAVLAAAAAVWMGVSFFWVIFPEQESGYGDDGEMVARLSGAKDCRWVGDVPGDEIARGQRLQLAAGYAEVTFDSGALVELEGPATLDVRSAWEAELHRGTLKANIPEEAAGFRVMNAAVEVIDLGTEFSMTAGEDGSAEVFVLRGAVEVQANGQSQRTVLREKQAKRFARAGASEVLDRDAKFERFARKVSIERLTRPLHSVRWDFNEGAGHRATSRAQGFPSLSFHGVGAWVPGRLAHAKIEDRALAFDGSLAATTSGPLRKNVRTIALWTQMPEVGGQGGAFLAVPLSKALVPGVELMVNERPSDGTPGALRVQAGGAWFIGSTPLRDGRWHHLAVVLGWNNKASKPTAALYVDGRLDTISGRAMPRRMDARKVSGDLPITLGAGLDGQPRWQGVVDALVLADRPLTPREIQHLIRNGELLSPEALAAY